MYIKKDELQTTLNVLLKLHDNKSALHNIMLEGGLQHENVAQASIAGIVRLLVSIRDGRKG